MGLLPRLLCATNIHTYTLYMLYPILYAVSQPNHSTIPSVCLSVRQSIQTVSRCSCQRSILQFIIIVIDSFEWLQWRKQGCQRNRQRERERQREGALVRAVTALLSIYLGPARFMHIRHGKLPETETETEISYRFLCLKIYTEMQLKIGEKREGEKARKLPVN